MLNLANNGFNCAENITPTTTPPTINNGVIIFFNILVDFVLRLNFLFLIDSNVSRGLNAKKSELTNPNFSVNKNILDPTG